MPWLILILSGCFEAVWAVALSRSEGFTRLLPSIVFVLACAFSMGGLAWSMKQLPVGTSYAVWVGMGATLTVAYAFVAGEEAVSPLKVLFIAMILGGVIGLKFSH
ncbi:SMR family transporter [Corynebacterium sp. H128]|uniref:DMT family transporter n=1 Tax=unclassified Corynebacterium TaxID=2624378 RepID=UPI00309FEBDD